MRVRLIFGLSVVALAAIACGPPGGSALPVRAPIAQQWLDRAQRAYAAGDVDDARIAAAEALKVAPRDADVRLTGARVALARLDFAEAIRLTEGLPSSEVAGLRGRARWYAGDLEQAADDLEAELQDPAVKDPWARDISKLARVSRGRHPFAIEGGILANVEMPQAGSALIVPCELDGERVLGMVATGSAEVVVDSGSRKEPQWVSLRFGDRVEVKDVPALAQDLSPLSRQVGGTVKVLLGANFLRHAHATFDRRGGQFIVRQEEASAPPDASRVPLFYSKGGAMLMKVAVNPRDDGAGLLYVDSSQAFSIALGDAMWKKAGVDVKALGPAPDLAGAKGGAIPSLRMGGFDFPSVPGFSIPGVTDRMPPLDLEPAGVMGAAMLELFRVTYADGGRFAWLEPDPTVFASQGAGARGRPPAAPAAAPPMAPDAPAPKPAPAAKTAGAIRP